MGTGRWEDTGRTYYSTRSIVAKSSKDARSYFKNSQINEGLDPNGVILRESCDGDDNPESNAIIIGLDVTGSMGYMAHEIAKTGLGNLIDGILNRKPVADPHIMFMAIGDVKTDRSPLQVSQFEADDRIVKQLEDIFVEGGGGNNQTESYDLPWYFAANRTSIDCFTKRGKKGYLFTIGDELPPNGLTSTDIKRVFGTDDQQNYTAAELLKMAEEKYHVFHLVVEEGYFAGRHPDTIHEWKKLMGNRAIPLSNHKHLSEVILSCIQLSEADDADVDSIIESWQDEEIRATVKHAFMTE